jgi:hypothetical protein
MWQLDAYRAIEVAALRRGAVHVQAFGSLAAGTVDEWSDVDGLVVVPDGDLDRFWPDRSWLPPLGGLGEPVAYKQWPFGVSSGVTQVLLDDGRHLDIMVIEDSAAEARLALLADLKPVTAPGSLDNIANELLFDAMGAVARSARGERLLATQLALRLLDHCVAAAMVIRDLSTGTCVHPRPAAQDALVDLLPGIPSGPQPEDVLRLVTAAFDCFNQITADAGYEPVFPRTAIDRLIQRAASRT